MRIKGVDLVTCQGVEVWKCVWNIVALSESAQAVSPAIGKGKKDGHRATNVAYVIPRALITYKSVI